MGIMTGCKIIDFCLQKSIEIVGIHSVEAGCKAWHRSAYMCQCLYYILLRCHYIRSLYPCMSAFKNQQVPFRNTVQCLIGGSFWSHWLTWWSMIMLAYQLNPQKFQFFSMVISTTFPSGHFALKCIALTTRHHTDSTTLVYSCTAIVSVDKCLPNLHCKFIYTVVLPCFT